MDKGDEIVDRSMTTNQGSGEIRRRETASRLAIRLLRDGISARKKCKAVRFVYESISEFVHPNGIRLPSQFLQPHLEFFTIVVFRGKFDRLDFGTSDKGPM